MLDCQSWIPSLVYDVFDGTTVPTVVFICQRSPLSFQGSDLFHSRQDFTVQAFYRPLVVK